MAKWLSVILSKFKPKPSKYYYYYIIYFLHSVIVSSDCKTMLLKGTNTLAGSCVSMLDIFHNLVNKLNVPIPQAVRMLAENPAK